MVRHIGGSKNMGKKLKFFMGLAVIVLMVSWGCNDGSKRSSDMSKDFVEKSKKEINEIIKKIIVASTEGHPENLKHYYHENMMIVSPELKVLGKGIEACIKGLTDFINQATIIEHHESEPEIDVFENTAIASYKYDFTWEMKGKSHKESGHSLFVFTYTGGKWVAVWRKLVPIKK